MSKYWIASNPNIYISGSSDINSTASAVLSSAVAGVVGHIRVKVQNEAGSDVTLLIPLCSSATSS